ncbi:Ca2+-binding RTX toxin-like protein [Sphingomonas sp. F9_3S_D5_B_2]
MPAAGDDYVANDFRDPNYQTDISTGAGQDYIWTHIFKPVMHIDGGSGFDIFEIPDGWSGNFSIQEVGNGDYVINHGQGTNIFYVTNVEMIIISAFDTTIEIFNDPFFTDGDNTVDFNHLTELQSGLFDAVDTWLSSNIRGADLFPDVYGSRDGDDTVYLPNGANFVIHDDSYDPVDIIWNYANTFYAGRGNDHVVGGDYNDIFDGGPGKDVLEGGAGNDTISDDPFDGEFGFLGGSIDGGAGKDTAKMIYSPHRIVDASGTVLWQQGDSAASITLDGQLVYAQYIDAAGDVIGSIRIVNVETITGLLATTSPSELLFNQYANTVNFTSLGAHEKAAIDALQTNNSLTFMYDAQNGNDIVTLPSNGTLLGKATHWDSSITFDAGLGDDIVIGSGSNDHIDGDWGEDRLEGRAGNDVLSGGADNDLLIGGTGADEMSGGYGDDIYEVDNAGDAVTEASNSGIDLVRSSLTYALGPYVENLTLTGTAAINGNGSGINNVLTGNAGNNVLSGFGGDDTLEGGAGNDRLVGGAGADTYIVDSVTDVIVEEGSDTDTVQSTVSFTLSNLVENLTLEGSSAINATGNESANTLTGNASANVLNGMGGSDRMVGLGGNDTYHVDSIWDVVVEGADSGVDTVISEIDYVLADNLENLTLTGSLNRNGTGNALANVLRGNSAANILDGGAGVDSMVGGAGDDTYLIDQIGDSVEESAAGGTDTVSSAVSYTLRANLENLILTGAALLGTGNSVANSITGNANNNVLDGAAGADVLTGGDGADTYYVDNIGDQVVETAGLEVDAVYSTVTYALGENVENLTLAGPGAINGSGNYLDNRLVGNAAANTLDGGTGADNMRGAAGNDTYVVDNSADRAVENAGEGEDSVFASIDYSLGANLENLVLNGFGDLSARGNDLDNVLGGNVNNNALYGNGGDDLIYGDAGNDKLDGGAGVDKMFGGLGDDTYIVRDATDFAYENVGEGVDRVLSSISIALRSNVENLTLTGTETVTGKGNELGNVITGNAANNALYGYAGDDKLYGGDGNDVLNGGTGKDGLTGGAGNDTYYVDDLTTYAYENVGEGTDRVYSTVNLTLRANIENLILSGNSAINGSGNAIDNRIWGNGASNTLHGAAGNDKLYGDAGADKLYGDDGDDWLEGGSGADTLYGGAGKDTFAFRNGELAGASDNIIDFTHGDDHIRLDYVDANTMIAGDQAFHFIGTATFDGTAGALRYEQVGTATYVSGDTDGDGAADFTISLQGDLTLLNGDFAL